jgi:hypothetical protein
MLGEQHSTTFANRRVSWTIYWPAATCEARRGSGCISGQTTEPEKVLSLFVPVLSRVQQNGIYQLAERAGLNPLDFSWDTTDQEYRGTTERITHGPTQAWLDFSITNDRNIWMQWWPRFGTADPRLFTASWDGALMWVAPWLDEVKKNHDAPDLWAEARNARALSDVVGDVEADNTPFTLEEVELLKPRLQDVADRIESSQPLDAEQKQVVRKRFQYLLEAAQRGVGRVDWLSIFIGQLFEMGLEKILEPSTVYQAMSYARTALSGLYHFGERLLGP